MRYVNLRLRLVCAGISFVRKAAGVGPPPTPPSSPPPPPPVSGVLPTLTKVASSAQAGQHQGQSSPQSVSSVRSPVLPLLRLVNRGLWFRVWGLGSHSSIFLLLLLFLTLSLLCFQMRQGVGPNWRDGLQGVWRMWLHLQVRQLHQVIDQQVRV